MSSLTQTEIRVLYIYIYTYRHGHAIEVPKQRSQTLHHRVCAHPAAKISSMHSRDIVAIVELLFYLPTAILAIITCFRHGFHRSSGWIYTLILCQVRIAGAVCQFLSHSNHSSGLIQATIIIDSIGLSPLLLATLGMLSRL
jgi:hypothetical protein